MDVAYRSHISARDRSGAIGAVVAIHAALLGNEKTGNLTLHLRCHRNSAGFCQCLHSRCCVPRWLGLSW